MNLYLELDSISRIASILESTWSKTWQKFNFDSYFTNFWLFVLKISSQKERHLASKNRNTNINILSQQQAAAVALEALKNSAASLAKEGLSFHIKSLEVSESKFDNGLERTPKSLCDKIRIVILF